MSVTIVGLFLDWSKVGQCDVWENVDLSEWMEFEKLAAFYRQFNLLLLWGVLNETLML